MVHTLSSQAFHHQAPLPLLRPTATWTRPAPSAPVTGRQAGHGPAGVHLAGARGGEPELPQRLRLEAGPSGGRGAAGPENGFHALRHHFASALLHNGVDIRALAAYLGHSDPGFTLRTYVHLMPDADDRMRQAVDVVMNAAAGPDGPATAREGKR
jgi:Phage integrase family